MTSTRQPPQQPAQPASAGPPADLTLVALIEAQQRPLWRYLRLLGADAHEADDLMQDTFVQFASTKRDNLQSPIAFLRGIARNLLLAARRRQQRDVPNAHWLHAVEELAAAEPQAFEDARIDALRACIERLQGRARQAIELHHVEGLSRQQTAAQLGIGDEGVKSLLSRTREVLRQCVEQRTETLEPS